MRKELFSKNRDSKIDWENDIEVAEQLQYPYVVIELLAGEPNPIKRQHILSDARNGKYGDSRK